MWELLTDNAFLIEGLGLPKQTTIQIPVTFQSHACAFFLNEGVWQDSLKFLEERCFQRASLQFCRSYHSFSPRLGHRGRRANWMDNLACRLRTMAHVRLKAANMEDGPRGRVLSHEGTRILVRQ